MLEVAASLPALPGGGTGAEQVFAAMGLQRLRLHRDQQVPKWGPDGQCSGAVLPGKPQRG